MRSNTSKDKFNKISLKFKIIEIPIIIVHLKNQI
jgi:hypothetical protein